MKATSALAGGLAGACALTVIHEIMKRVDPEAPRMDLLGMDAIAKTLRNTDEPVPENDNLYNIALAGDIASNTLFYSLAGIGNRKSALLRGAALGLAAGVGAVTLPGPLGLIEEASNRTNKTKALTVGMYMLGGLVASGVSSLLESETKARKERKRNKPAKTTRTRRTAR